MADTPKAQTDAFPLPTEIEQLRGTSRRLAELILEHGTYEYEGFNWLQGTFGGIAQHLNVSAKTIARLAGSAPFHHISLRTPEHGKHVLIKLGTAPCQTDFVRRLRSSWKIGLAYFNGAAAKAWPIEAQKAKHAGLPYKHLLSRIKEAQKWEPVLEKLKAGERISYEVKPHEVGLLRECIKRLGDDAFIVIPCLTSWSGWHLFISYAKIADRVKDRHYHWPTLGPIAGHPDIALQAYLDSQQKEGKISLQESNRLNAKIATLEPKPGLGGHDVHLSNPFVHLIIS